MTTPLLRIVVPLALLAGCHPPATDPPICASLVGSQRADESDTRVLQPTAWFRLLIRDLRQPASMAPPEPHDCTGRTITAMPPGPISEKLPPAALGASDLTFAPGPEGHMLVWARVERFADGTARGPVALIRRVARGIEVRGIGTLWAPAGRVRLRLERFGELQLLVADSQVCASKLPDSCTRQVQLMPLVGQRFVAADLREEGSDAPAGPARVTMRERSDVRMDDGWMRRADVQRHVRVHDDHITIAEELRVRDCDPTASPETCRERLRVREDRPVAWKDGRFSAPASAWAQVARP